MSYGWLADQGLFEVMNLGKLTLFHISDQYPSVFPIGYTGLALVGILFMIIGMLIPISPFKKKLD